MSRLWLIRLARRSGLKLPGAELELADVQLASWAKAALVGWFYMPPTKVNRRPPNEAWLRPNGFRFSPAIAMTIALLGRQQGLRPALAIVVLAIV